MKSVKEADDINLRLMSIKKILSTRIKEAKEILSARSIKDLVELFEMTEASDEEYNYIVRGWIMDELGERNPAAFDTWLDIGYDDSPRKYFIGRE